MIPLDTKLLIGKVHFAVVLFFLLLRRFSGKVFRGTLGTLEHLKFLKVGWEQLFLYDIILVF